MAVHIRLLCILVLLKIACCSTSIIGLYCQDPDTRKLYPINSTWQSETFCGNYTCKLRKKNITETEYVPVTRINITKSHLDNLEADMSTSPSEHSVMINKDPTRQPVFHKDMDKKINNLKEELKNNKSEDGDRYLSETEIKSITEILHTIKKSDLEAIVEIYNIAQEIYKDIDGTTDDLIQETKNSIKNDNIKIKNKHVNSDKSISYWYEPLHKNNNKGKPIDLKIDATNAVPVHSYPYSTPYTNSPIVEQDLAKSPYYYPVSSFHKMSSYLHNSPYVPEQNIPKIPKPCNKKINYVPSWYNPAPNNSPIAYKKATTQPMLLPYPFSYVNHYNFSYPSYYYNSNYPWAQLDVYNRNKNYISPYYSGYLTPVPNTAIITNAEQEDRIDEQNEIRYEDNTKKPQGLLPDWQTEPLSANVLEDIKANMPEKSKLIKSLSLGKNLKLEKVGKVVKVDEASRSKRETNVVVEKGPEKEEFEAYVERTTCKSSTEPGYFRVGNDSEPYPACCPQKIRNR